MRTGPMYVGYLPLPKADRRGLRVVVPCVAAGMLVLAAVIAGAQRDPGGAVWDTGNAREYVGVVVADPYPMLISEDGAYLVVEVGKRGSQGRLNEHAGRTVAVDGFLLERAGRRMIELMPDASAIRTLPERRGAAIEITGPPRPITVVGEILDSKCYLGAMKPGDGKAHKACATLCFDGGIPPMLYAVGPDGSRTYYVVDAQGDPQTRHHLRGLLGEPVTVSGEMVRLGDVEILRVNPYSFTRR